MGYGGYFELINGTPYEWAMSGNLSYHMNHWNFPPVVKSGYSENIYVELSNAFYVDPLGNNDNSGSVNYSIIIPGNANDGTTSFTISFQNSIQPDGFKVTWEDINIESNSLTVPIPPLDLGFQHDSGHSAQFVLSDNDAKFASLNQLSNWMTNNMNSLGCQPLKQICIPGSHDAGMSKFYNHTTGALAENTVTQGLTLYSQLLAGIRWFDLRPVWASGEFQLGHYSNVANVGQGATGESINDLITAVNNFTALPNYNELIILAFGGSFETSTCFACPFGALNATRYTALMTQLQQINHLYVAPQGTTDLTSLSLDCFVANGPAVIIYFQEGPGANQAGNFPGMYSISQFPMNGEIDGYSDTSIVTDMVADQIAKLVLNRPTPSSTSFAMWWTLTQFDVIGTSITDLADIAYTYLYVNVWTALAENPGTYPNVLIADDIKPDGGLAALTLAINKVVSPGCPQTQSLSSLIMSGLSGPG